MRQMFKTNSLRLILLVVTVLVILGAASTTVSAQGKKKGKGPRTRVVTIYVEEITAHSLDGAQRIVPVSRTIPRDKPLSRALKLLLKGPTDEEREQRNLSFFISDLKFVSARVRNRTAQINFRFENEDLVEESWEGSGFRNEDFVNAVEQTARQFPGIERVLICVNGIKNYADFGAKPVKCSFPMFRTQE